MLPDISTYLSYAEVAMFTDASYNSFLQFTKGGMPVPRYVRLLYIVYSSVKYKFSKSPTDESLFDTAEYMYALSGGRNVTPSTPSTPFIIIVQPQSQTVDTGDDVTFFVVVGGGVPTYTYQWYKNGVLMSGETSDTLNLTNVDSGDAAGYYCIIQDSASHSLQSNTATLTVNTPALFGFYYYGTTNYYAALSSGTDAITYQGSFGITHNNPLSVPFPLAAGVEMFLVIRVPIGESLKTAWSVTGFDFGTIPDSVFQAALQPVGLPLYTYYCTRIESSHDFNNPMILT